MKDIVVPTAMTLVIVLTILLTTEGGNKALEEVVLWLAK